MQDRILLPFHFNVDLLQKDLQQLDKTSSEWIDHFVKQNYVTFLFILFPSIFKLI